MDEIQKQNEQTIKTDFVRQFFFDRMSSILDANEKYSSPAEFSTIANADLDGSLEVIPEEDRESVSSVPQATINAIIEDKAQKETEKQISEANNRNNIIPYQIKDAAIKANRNDLPFVAQTALTSMYLDALAEEKNSGRMSAKFERDMIIEYAEDITIDTLGKYLTSDELSSQQKLKLLQDILHGKTGNNVIDALSSPAERAKFISEGLGLAQKYDNYKEALRKEDERKRKESFESLFGEAVDKVVNENLDLYQIQDEMKYLLSFAKTNEERQQVSELLNFAYPKDSSPLAVLEMEEAKKDGTFDTALVLKHVSMGTLVGSDAKKYLREANEPLNVNLSTETAKMLIDIAKINFANKPEDLALWTRAFTSRLKGSVLSDIDISKAAEDAYKTVYPKTGETKVEKAERTLEEAKANGINKTKFNSILNNSIQKAMDAQGVNSENRLDLEGQKLAYMNMRTEMRKYIKEEKSKNRPVSIENQNGDIITDEDTIIDYWIAMARKKRGW